MKGITWNSIISDDELDPYLVENIKDFLIIDENHKEVKILKVEPILLDVESLIYKIENVEKKVENLENLLGKVENKNKELLSKQDIKQFIEKRNK